MLKPGLKFVFAVSLIFGLVGCCSIPVYDERTNKIGELKIWVGL